MITIDKLLKPKPKQVAQLVRPPPPTNPLALYHEAQVRSFGSTKIRIRSQAEWCANTPIKKGLSLKSS